jgi:hypothetical protein
MAFADCLQEEFAQIGAFMTHAVEIALGILERFSMLSCTERDVEAYKTVSKRFVR